MDGVAAEDYSQVNLGYGMTSIFILVAAGMLVFGCINASSLWLGAWGQVRK
jgi:hypothetical protein